MSLGGIVVSALANFGFVVIAGRTLGARNGGAVFEGIAVLTICTYGAMFGTDVGILKLMPKIRRESPGEAEFRLTLAAFLPPVIIGLIICLLLISFRADLAELVVRRGNRVATARVLVEMAPFVPVGGLMWVATAGMRLWSIRDMVLLQYLAIPILRLVLIGALIANGLTPTTAAVAWTVPTAAGALVAAGYVIKKTRRSKGPIPLASRRIRVVVELWRFSGPRSLSGIFQILVGWLDVLLVGAMASSRQAAAYAVASRYIVTGTFALAAMGLAIAPQLSRLFDRLEFDEAKGVYRESTWWIMAATWPILGVLVLFAPFMMRIFGHGYSSGAICLEILGLAMLLNTGTGNNAIALMMGGGSKENLGINAASLAVNVALNLVLIPRFAAEGAAMAWAASITITSIATSYFLYRRTKLLPFGKGYGAIALAALVAYGVVGLAFRAALGSGLAPALSGAAASTLVFFGLLACFRSALNLQDLRNFAVREREYGEESMTSTVDTAG